MILLPAAGLACGGLPASLAAGETPNILFILVDDMGYGDLGCYGSEIETPNIDSLARGGLRFTQMYNTAKCMSSRACLLTGLYAQQCDMDVAPVVMKHAATLGEVLRTAGYRTLASGKHHGTENLINRGFDHYYGLRDGMSNFWNPGVQRDGEPVPVSKGTIRHWCDDTTTYAPYTPEDRGFYTTDAFTNRALQWLDEPVLNDKPFFLYLAYTAPHYPLHAWPEDIAKYHGRYDAGYEAIREARYSRMVQMGLVDPQKSPLLPWAGRDWKTLAGLELAKEKRRMEIYAAMLDRADQNIGRVLDKLRAQGKLENTLIMFASDNGASSESPSDAWTRSTRLEDFGTIASFETVGPDWATVQNTPLRYWKNYTHEGGIRTPFIVSWPGRISSPGGVYHEAGHFIDIMPTLVRLTGAVYPTELNGQIVIPMPGTSLLPALENKSLIREKPIFWQWDVGGGVRDGNWKAVFWDKQWELIDFSQDHNEFNDLGSQYPDHLSRMKRQYEDWYRESKRPPLRGSAEARSDQSAKP